MTKSPKSHVRSGVPASSILTYSFPDGTTVKGTIETLEKTARALGFKINADSLPVPEGYYRSQSGGLMKISIMNDYHLRRALVRRAKDYLDGIYRPDQSNGDFVNGFLSLTEDQTINDLFLELNKRASHG